MKKEIRSDRGIYLQLKTTKKNEKEKNEQRKIRGATNEKMLTFTRSLILLTNIQIDVCRKRKKGNTQATSDRI